MRIKTALFAILLGAKAAYADKDQVVAALKNVSEANGNVNTTINKLSADVWDIIELAYLQKYAFSLRQKTIYGVLVAQLSANLTDNEGFAVGAAASQLAIDTNTTVESMIRAAPQLAKVPRLPYMMVGSLREQRKASANLTEALVDITPEDSKDAGRDFGEQIDKSLAMGMDVFCDIIQGFIPSTNLSQIEQNFALRGCPGASGNSTSDWVARSIDIGN